MTSLGRELRDEVGRQRGRVGERLVERVGERGEEQRGVGTEHELAVLGPVALGDQRARRRARRTSAPRSRSRTSAPARRDSSAASAASAEESIPPESSTPTGTSESEVRADRVAEPRAQLLDQLGLVVVAQLVERGPGPREALGRASPSSQTSTCPAGSLRVSRKIVSGAGIELKARNASSASRSISPRGRARSSEANSSVAAGDAVVERLDPVAVSGEHEPPLARVPERDREHPAQPPREVEPVLLVEVDEHLGVAVRAEAVARALELGAQLRGSCRARRSGRRASSRPRSRSAGRRPRGR